ncbi:MAG: DEAD/DEAH box helicase [Fusobacteriaceae bacterium]
MLKNSEKGIYVVAVSKDGQEIKDIEEWLLEDEWLSLSDNEKNILNFINKSSKKEIYGDWDDIWGEGTEGEEFIGETYLKEEGSLVDMLLQCENFVDEDYQKVKFSPQGNHLSLVIKECENESARFSASFLLNGIHNDITFIENDYAFRDGKFYKLDINNSSLYDLESFVTTFQQGGLEHYLTIFNCSFENIEVNCLDYMVEIGERRKVTPQLVIEKISQDKSLYLKILVSASNMDYRFLREHNVNSVTVVNPMEKKIIVSPLDTGNLETIVTDLTKALTKHKKNVKIKNSYYLDEDNLLIIQENLAKEFIGKELLNLANRYKVIGTEKLKSYNIRAVKPKIVGSFRHSIDFLEGEVDIEIEGEKFSIKDILSTYKTDSYVVLSDGTNALINHKYIEKLERIFQKGDSEKSVKISFFDMPIIEDLIDEKIYSDTFKGSREFFSGINNLSQYEPVFPDIKATLREYQIYGYKWLSYLIDNNLGCCLADDMGLGKTLQAITLLSSVHLDSRGTSLVVMPKSLIYNWENEIKKFNPKLRANIYYGPNRDLGIIPDSDVVITTYGTVRNDIEKLRNYNFKLIILDESQNIKNINAQTTKAIMLLNAENRLALSGTPIENNLTELYSLFRFLNPSMFGSLEEFNSYYANPIQKENDKEAIEELRKKIYPFILRRIKKEVLKDLPEKIEQTVYIEMNKDHRKLYNERRNYYYNMVNSSIKEQGIGKSQFFIFQALNELRMLTSCPESKDPQVMSSKREMLINNISDAVSNGHKVLVFTNYINSIENICEDLKKRNIKHMSMTGATKNRQELVDRFQKDSSYKVFVMTLKTGGVGLNLTSADTIFIYDPWWNKTVENQAVDRAYRLGQDRTVFSYKLILKDSIEEKILKLQEVKSELLDNLISADNASVKALSEEDIKFILGGDL